MDHPKFSLGSSSTPTGARTARPMMSSEARKHFKCLEGITTIIKSSEDWIDAKLLEQKYIDLGGYRNIVDIDKKINMLKKGLKPLYHSVSAQMVGRMLQLAWGLVAPDHGYYIFTDVSMSHTATSVESLGDRIAFVDENADPITNITRENFDHCERTAAFYCAAALRLVTKDEKNLSNAWNSLQHQYRNLYREPVAFEIRVSLECLRQTRQMLQMIRVLKGSIACFLYSLLDLPDRDMGICRFLFETHLAYTGLHAYNLMLHVISRSGAPPEVVFELLRHPARNPALEMIKKLRILETDEAGKSKRSWKYARIFDPEAYAVLQTKNCTMLVSLLAVIAKKLGGMGDPTSIREIKKYVEGMKDRLEISAQIIIDKCEAARHGLRNTAEED